MTDCNAQLRTWTETDDVVGLVHEHPRQGRVSYSWHELLPDGVGVVRRGDRLMREEHHVLTCDRELHVSRPDMHYSRHPDDPDGLTTWWSDDTPGAVSHADNTPPADEHTITIIDMMLGTGPAWQWSCTCTAHGDKPYRLKSNAVMDADQHCKDHEPPPDDAGRDPR